MNLKKKNQTVIEIKQFAQAHMRSMAEPKSLSIPTVIKPALPFFSCKIPPVKIKQQCNQEQ